MVELRSRFAEIQRMTSPILPRCAKRDDLHLQFRGRWRAASRTFQLASWLYPRETANVVSRRYPLDPPHNPPGREPVSRQGWLDDDSVAMRLASASAEILLDIGEWRRRHLDLSQAFVGITLLLLGLALGGAAAITDGYLHRGVESGAEQPYIVQPTGKGLATNIDFRSYSPAQLGDFASALNDGGFQFVRQEFSWGEIESARGAYDWSQYDTIVAELNRQGIGMIAVIVDTPEWARSIGQAVFANAPPRDPESLHAFTNELALRFGENVPFVQIWDRPNTTDNWGGQTATGAEFTPYLEAAWRGARSGSASIRVVSPELAVTSDTVGGQSDLAFMESMYAANASPYIDIVGIALDGGVFSPDDRRVSESRTNFSRAILFRELMLSNSDVATPVWATSYGWAAGEAVTRDEQAEFVERGMERSWSEWPWMGLMVQWAFLPPQDSATSSFAMVNPNGTATPLYQRLTSQEVVRRSRIANTGFAPMDSDSITDSGHWQDQHLEGRTFRTTQQAGASLSIEFQGTGLIAFVRSGPEVGSFTIEVDGEIVPGGAGESGDEWDFSFLSSTDDFPRTLVDDLDDSRHTMAITLLGGGELTLGGVEITRQAPFVWPISLMTVGSIILLFFALRSIAFLFATRAGHLRRRTDPDPDPQLPRLANWRPERRIS
ncbi:hypothetical protein BH24CHL3_BH24CHL3_01290 [soil metagenome]